MQEREDIRKLFEDAHQEFLEPLFRYFLYRLGDPDRSKELAQETFMRAWTYAAKGRAIKAMKSFLFTTASNLFKNELRAKRPVSSLDELMEAGVEFVSDTASPENLTEAKRLLHKLELLSESYREVLLLRFVDGLSAREIADSLGQTEIAVAVRIHRALKKLRTLHESNL